MSSGESRPAFHLPDHLSRDEIHKLHELSNVRSALALATTYGLVAAAFAAMARWPTPPVFVLGVVILGGRQLALGVLTHEAAHRTLFTNRRVNEWVGQWLCARMIWSDMPAYRAIHLRHHLLAATIQDPDLSLVAPYPMTRAQLVKSFVRDLVGVTAIFRVGANLLTDLGFIELSVSGDIRLVDQAGRSSWDVLRAGLKNLGGVALAHGPMFALLWIAGHPLLYLCWWLAWGTTFNAFARVRAIEDHACTPDVVHPIRHSRTTYASIVERLTVAPHNISYHLEHHLLMRVPFFRLRELHELLLSRGALEGACIDSSCFAVLAHVSRPNGAPPPVRPPGARVRVKPEAPADPPRARGKATGILPIFGAALASFAARLRGHTAARAT